MRVVLVSMMYLGAEVTRMGSGVLVQYVLT